MNANSSVLVVGGGAIGVCAAYYLNEAGFSVTLLDKNPVCGHQNSSSYGNAGLVATEYAIPVAAPGALSRGLRWMLDPGSPFYIKPRLNIDLIRWLWKFWRSCTESQMRKSIPVLLKMGRASLALFEELAAHPDLNFGYERKGRLLLFNTEAGMREVLEEMHLLAEYGVQAEVLDADGVKAREPNVQPGVIGGIFLENYAHLVPHQFVRQLADLAQARGVTIHQETEVLGWETETGRIRAARTTRGNFQAETVVLAAGSWSPQLGRPLGLRLPVEAAKGYSFTARQPATCPKTSLALEERRVAVTPMGDKLRFSSTLELAGLDLSVNQTRLNATRAAMNEYLTGMEDLHIEEVWRGLRPTTPDSLPLIGRAPNIQNLIVATGHGMLGITHGPLTGQLVAQILSGDEPALDLTPFRVDRFN